MCDTLCVVGPEGTLFAKNSDRPPGEAQVVEAWPARPRRRSRCGPSTSTWPTPGAAALLGSRPAWLWGCEHGVNEHGVAIGNEKVWTVDDARAVPPALLGMDLVRLALERGRTADEALEHLTALLAEHGQGGSGEEEHDEPYFSSFLIADASRRVGGRDERPDVGGAPGRRGRGDLQPDLARHRLDPGVRRRRARPRLPGLARPGRARPASPTTASPRPARAWRRRTGRTGSSLGPADLVATLRDHGHGPWGAPGGSTLTTPVPTEVDADWNGVTVCMHVARLPGHHRVDGRRPARRPEAPMRAWVALGSPCASVYVPVFPPLARAGRARRPRDVVALRRTRPPRRAGRPTRSTGSRQVLAPVEAELWERADDAAKQGTAGALDDCVAAAWAPVDAALTRLGV